MKLMGRNERGSQLPRSKTVMSSRIIPLCMLVQACAAFAWAGSFREIGQITPNSASADGSIVAGYRNVPCEYFTWTEATGVVGIGGACPGSGSGGQPVISNDGRRISGDANLDSIVDGSDFVIWNAHKFTANAAWCLGDFTADGFVDGADFIAWNMNKFQSATSFVPEPGLMVWQVVSLTVTAMLGRRRPYRDTRQ